MKKRIILKRLLLSTAVLTVASTAIIVQQHNSVDKTVKTEECSKQDIISNSAESKVENLLFLNLLKSQKLSNL